MSYSVRDSFESLSKSNVLVARLLALSFWFITFANAIAHFPLKQLIIIIIIIITAYYTRYYPTSVYDRLLLPKKTIQNNLRFL